ncbi:MULTISPECIES: DUF7144 family membrane protein [unclassified Streptomyces]|uniref:DUF7144 family membrane protein n=1 Tax=unclassified Streptomyces TaxID=2593676 RepID=UPI0004BFCF84|nr:MULTISPECIES: hypothetical protein [unclassified Streptomyces]
MAATHTRPTHTARRGTAAGLAVFAAVMLFLVGLLDIFRGVMAIAEDDIFVATRNYVFEFDLTGWGWIHLILGALSVLVALGLFRARTWARVLGVALAALLIITNFLTLPQYPIWSVVMIALSGFVIWALCTVRSEDLA